jgi:hypothetical protein
MASCLPDAGLAFRIVASLEHVERLGLCANTHIKDARAEKRTQGSTLVAHPINNVCPEETKDKLC